jgi:hypothetical protein
MCVCTRPHAHGDTHTPSHPHAQVKNPKPQKPKKPKFKKPKKKPEISKPILKNGFQKRNEKDVKNLKILSSPL